MAHDMSPTDRLEAIEAIRFVKARYFRGLDTKDWDLLASVWADDAVFDTRQALGAASIEAGSTDPFSEQGYLRGKTQIMDTLKALGSLTTVSVHHGHMEEIQILGPTRAEAIFAMDDRVEWAEGAAPLRALRGFGHYHDKFERVNGVWLMTFSLLTRLHVIAR